MCNELFAIHKEVIVRQDFAGVGTYNRTRLHQFALLMPGITSKE